MRILILILLAGCGAKAQDRSELLFSQDITNYGIVRYENAEAICYKKDQAFTCTLK